ncbi:alpha/beta fold hydrolase [Luteococcus peritonei]|uniref:Alpha/beta fold hydrolase n=1 Tax=Luteococcus peritonei TaxID=88874 RepID=A0ABW4RWS0_9ACTN
MPKKKDSATTVAQAPLPVRARMRTLEKLSPRHAARVAEHYWFTVPPAPSAKRLNRFTPDGGAPFFLMSGESEIRGESFGPEDGPLAVLVHGWGGYWQQLGAHVPALVQAGYHVVAYDAPSHGGSTHGAEGFGSGSVLEMAQAFGAVLDELGRRPALVMAHSIGAMAVMRAQRERQAADAYVLIAPEVRLEPAIDWFSQVIGMGPRTRSLFLERVQQRVGIDLSDFDMTADVRRTVAGAQVPALLAIHDTDDPDTPAAETRKLVEHWPGAELMLTNSLGHRQVIWHDEVKKRVADFVARLDTTPGIHALPTDRSVG